MNTAPLFIHALCSPDAYPHPVSAVQLIETHISWVLLTGEFAYKIKKPVNFGFLDFSTLELRRFFCHEEVRLNQRLAKDWYLEAVPVTGSFDQPKMGGNGPVLEHAVKMRQFPSEKTLKDEAEARQLTAAEIGQIADLLADFHGRIGQAGEDSPFGRSEDIRHWCEENFTHIRPLLDNGESLKQLEKIAAWSEAASTKLSRLMQQRKRQGFIRECHGDLHLGNMTLVDGKVVAFDCIEFNPLLRWIDVISEAAFVAMDLFDLGYADFAWRFLNRYLQQAEDYIGIALLRYYLVYRAMVRAKVALLRKTQTADPALLKRIHSEYRIFADLALSFIRVKSRCLVITHGFSGSGKSTYAAQLAERIGAFHLRSDLERKRLFGLQPQEKSGSAINGGIYSASATRQTYAHLAELAKIIFQAGFPVLVDAAFLMQEQRLRFRQLAEAEGADFRILDFQAAPQTLAERISQRENDPSEATLAVLHKQQACAEALTAQEQKDVIPVNTEQPLALEELLARLKLPD